MIRSGLFSCMGLDSWTVDRTRHSFFLESIDENLVGVGRKCELPKGQLNCMGGSVWHVQKNNW